MKSSLQLWRCHVVLGLGPSLDLEIEQMDLTTLFYIDLEESIYMDQPDGFIVKEKEHYVCRLKKSLNDIK